MTPVSELSLSPQQLDFYRSNGYLVLESVMKPEDCAQYLECAERIAQGRTLRYTPIINPHQLDPLFKDLLRHPVILRTLEALLGSRVHALQSLFYFKEPGSLGRDMHQDNFYARTDRDAFMGTWISLEASDRENGGLVVYPGSHREDLLEIVEDVERRKTNIGDFQNDRGLFCPVPAHLESQKMYLSVPAGSMVFIHGHLIHGSEENHSRTRFRRIFAAHYIKQGYDFVPGKHAKRQIIDVYS